MKGKCHFIGIGGIGMSGLARILLARKIEVSGSDISTNYVTESLMSAGVQIFSGHAAQNISENTTVIYGSDIKKDNPEYQQALKLNCSLLHRSELLSQLMHGYQALAVAGTHGKTTTSALLTAVLSAAKQNPSFAVGGILPQFQSNAAHNQGTHFVAEADESDGTFLNYHPFGAIITNIDFDHMNHFGTEAALIKAFQQFASQVTSQQHLLWCGDDQRLANLNLPGISYGFGSTCQLQACNFKQTGWKICFDAHFKGRIYPEIEVSLIGRHNALNALAVFGLALSLGLSENEIRAGLASFGGVMRRCEKKGEIQGVLMLDDYAHHPTEIKTTLQGIRSAIGERRLIAVFQPHRYSRTLECLGTYKGIFDAADEMMITDIFSAGETPIPGLTHFQILNEVQCCTKIPCRYTPRSQLFTELAKNARPHDVIVSLGAGDITKLGGELYTHFKQHSVNKLRVGVVFGGCSLEHEISLVSASYICSSLQKEYYNVQQFGITKHGRWLSGENAMNTLHLLAKTDKVTAPQGNFEGHILSELLACDVLFPVLHGSFGEDGTIQGFFETLGKAYVGCDYRSSAITMDKALCKKLVMREGVASSPFVDFNTHEWHTQQSVIRSKIRAELTYPLFVKPVHLGSSVGVTKISNEDQLEEAVRKAFEVDSLIIVENGIRGREIEFPVLGNAHIKVFPPGEILTDGAVYDYDAKYGPNGIKAIPEANLSDEQRKIGMKLAEKAFKAAGCSGMARVDFFLDENGKFWFNEINPIPGFTPISLYPSICQVNGLPAPQLVDQLVTLALQRKRFQALHI